MKLPIYLDYSATTPVDPRVAEKMMQCLTLDGIFGNPASRSHRFGWQAEEVVDEARNHVADLIGAANVLASAAAIEALTARATGEKKEAAKSAAADSVEGSDTSEPSAAAGKGSDS